MFRAVGDKGNLSDCLHSPADMLRCRAAAAAYGLNAHLRDLFHPGGKSLRVNIIDCSAVLRAGQAGIGIDEDGDGGGLRQSPDDRNHLFGSQTAVDAQSVHPQTFQQSHRGIHRSAGQKLAGPIIDVGDQHRQIAVFLCCQHCRLGFVAVAHGLNEDQVRARFCSYAHDLAEKLHGTFKGQIAQRLEQAPCRTDIQGDIGVLPVCDPPCLDSQLHCGFHDLAQLAVRFV